MSVEQATGDHQSAGAAIVFSGAVGVTYFVLQTAGVATSDGYIGPGALALISIAFVAIGGLMMTVREPVGGRPG